MKSNNGDDAQIKSLAKKERAIMGKIWSIRERKLKDDWGRVKLLNALMSSVVIYGACRRST